MKVALLGDVHGDLDRLVVCAHAAAQAGAGAAIQLGDLGFREDLFGIGRRWPRFPIPVLALCGNHEDHGFLRQAQTSGLAAAWAAHGLCYQARGSTARLGGRTVVFVGGALHADRAQDGDGRNLVSGEDWQTAQAACAVRPPDLIASHSCPAGIGIGMRGNPALSVAFAQHVQAAGYDTGPADDCGEPGLRRLWDGLQRRPTHWVFGHFHVSHAAVVGGTRFLACPEAEPGAIVYWDTERDCIGGD